jgi:hypothetical protein
MKRGLFFMLSTAIFSILAITVGCQTQVSTIVQTPPPVTTTITNTLNMTETQTEIVTNTLTATEIVPTTTTTTTTITITSMPSTKVLGSVALPLDPTFHPAAYATLCMLCHAQGVGVQQYPMAPTWAGTPESPGPWIVEKGSPADHTGRTAVVTCTTQAGCHTMGK